MKKFGLILLEGKMKRSLCVLLACMFFVEPIMLAAVRGHKSMYAAGTLAALRPGLVGRLETSDLGLTFTAEKGVATENIPYDTITAIEYGEHAGRRVGSTIALGIILGLPLLFSKKKRHYLTLYLNGDPKVAAQERERLAKDPKAAAKGDVAVFEINKHDYADMISILQAKTGVAVQNEEMKR